MTVEEVAVEDWRLEQRVPVEHRLLGLDRRYLLPLLGVAAVWLLWAVVLPAVDESISRSEVGTGDVVHLARGVSYTPAEGWVYAGTPAPGAPTSEVYSEGVSFVVHSGAFAGSSEELLATVDDEDEQLQVTGATRSVPLSGGVVGVAQEIHDGDALGALFAFAHDGTGVTVEIDGPANIVPLQTEDLGRMIAGIRFPDEDAAP